MANFLVVPIATAIGSLPVLFCAYFIIGFFDQKLPDLYAFKTFWQWLIVVFTGIGAWICFTDYLGAADALRSYEQGYLDWQERTRLESERRAAEEIERQRLAKLKRQRERTLKARRGRLQELEIMVLGAQAQHALKVDFFGAGNPTSILADFRRHLLQLGLADLGLLRESRNPAVLKIVEDGAILPALPPPQTPFKDPFLTLGEHLRLHDDFP